MIKFLGKNKFENPFVLHRFSGHQTIEDLEKLYNQKIEKDFEVYDGQCVILMTSQKTFHVVKPAETLKTIAQKYNTTEEKLKLKNKTKKLFIGQKIEI